MTKDRSAEDRTEALGRKKRLLELLDQALERPPEEQRALLDAACGGDRALYWEVEALLETEADGGVLAGPAFSVHSDDPVVGRRIDHYRLIRLLERGGMGAVYLAERDDFEKRVALKLIRRGLDADEILVRRFHNERQILARLDHPGIARLLDGGTTADRLPYFVMEYVEGESIDRYCEKQELDLDGRLELFRKVCSAVQFAHQNLVIHRDLKPGNILITAEGEPKLLDFGIAKLLDDGLAARAVETVLGQGPMTPRYASPEQVRLQPVTTASDVYSLGVLLYELLTGLDPYDLDTDRSDEIARAICDREPTKPSTAVRRRAPADGRSLRRRLAGDLDAIVLKAMRKEPQERYLSADQLSEDIRRHLEGLPVAARVGSLAYYAGKFFRRNKLALAVIAAFLLLLTTFSVVSTVLWRQAEREREKAELEQRRVQTAFQFLENLIKSADPDRAKGEKLTAFELLEYGRLRIVEDLKDEPELQIDLAGTLGDVFRKLGAYEESKELMATSLRVARQHYGGDHPKVAKRIVNLAVLLYDHEELSAAERRFREALEMRSRLGQEASKLFRTKGNLATILMQQAKFEEAEEIYLDVLETRVVLYGHDDEDVATSRRNLGALYYAWSEFEEAETQTRQALAIRRRILESEDADEASPVDVASALDLLGRVLAARDRELEAEPLYEEALDIWRRMRGDDHADTAATKKNLAALLANREPEIARVLADEALATFESSKPGGWEAADTRGVVGTILAAQGRYEEAEPLVVGSHARLVELRGERTTTTRRALERVLDLYEEWNRPDELERYRARSESVAE